MILFAVGMASVHYLDLKESRYILAAAYLFLANVVIIALILFAAWCMLDDDRKDRGRNPSPPRALPAWIQPDHLMRLNNPIMTAENAGAIVDLLRRVIMNCGKRRSETLEWIVDNDLDYLSWLLRNKQADPSYDMLRVYYSLLLVYYSLLHYLTE